MKSLARLVLKNLSFLSKVNVSASIIYSLEIFLAALQGRGGGSGWDSLGQTRALASLVKVDGKLIVLDVGANNGKWALDLSKNLENRISEFHLFECAPYCFLGLADSANRLPGARIVHKAVSDRSGTNSLYLPDTELGTGSGLASLHERKDSSVRSHTYRTIEVQTVSLDEYISENAISRVDILKIDVEGHELAVLSGASRAISDRMIDCIFFEFGSGNVNSRTYFRDFWDLLSTAGYKFFRVLPGGRVLRIEKYFDSHEYFRGATNYICLLDGTE